MNIVFYQDEYTPGKFCSLEKFFREIVPNIARATKASKIQFMLCVGGKRIYSEELFRPLFSFVQNTKTKTWKRGIGVTKTCIQFGQETTEEEIEQFIRALSMQGSFATGKFSENGLYAMNPVALVLESAE